MQATRWAPQLLRALLLWILIASTAGAIEDPQPIQTIDLDSGWEYRWGDSPWKDSTPAGVIEAEDAAWQPIDFPSNPPNREGRTNAWFRVELPDVGKIGHSLYIYSIDLIAEVYLDGERIYHYGSFDANGQGRFEGWPWHLIHLPDDYPGKTIYFRVFSDSTDIGLWGEVRLGSEYGHLQRIIHRDLFPFTVGFTLLTVALGCFLFGLFRRSSTACLLSLLFLNLGFIPILESQLKQLLVYAPLAWQYLAAGNYFLVPVSLAVVAHFLVGKGVWRCHQIVWQLHLAYLFGALLLAGLGVINLSTTYVYFDGLALFTLLAVALSMSVIARRGNLDQRIFAGGCWAVYVVLLYNGLTANGFLPWACRSEYLGPLLLLGGFIAILLRRYGTLKIDLRDRTRELEELNRTLEERIAERTCELMESNHTKDRFLAIIGHDLRGPIGTLAYLLDDYASQSEDLPADLLPPLRDSASEVHILLENLLLWASSQQGQLKAKKTTTYLRPLALTAFSQLRGTAEHKGISVTIDISPQCRVCADVEMVTTVLRNLLTNAIKFSERNHAVRIEAVTTGDRVSIACIDQGIGMSEDRLRQFITGNEKIATQPGTAGENGTGLGLVLCREFVHLHGSRLSAESAPAKGTIIRFELAAAPVTDADD